MDMTPTDPTPRRPRAKVAAKEPAAQSTKKPAARKTLSASRKKTSEIEAAVAMPAAAPSDLHGMIETAAFYLAAERSFAPGHELEDWLEAERRIKALHSA